MQLKTDRYLLDLVEYDDEDFRLHMPNASRKVRVFAWFSSKKVKRSITLPNLDLLCQQNGWQLIENR